MRFFEKISYEQFKKDISTELDLYNSIKLPVRSTAYSAGYDFFSINDIIIKQNEIIKIPTGIKVCLNDDEYLSIHIRSSLGVKNNVRMCNSVGIIDKDYYNNKDNEGHIWVFLQNEGDKDIIIKQNDRFVQGIFVKYLLCDYDNMNIQQRTGGFGSTNKESE